ncbi:MAG: T9SS type A sorting domain-containing protein, partial [Candidatus Latescibacteria bacterium]|nr:T9SS type A sorting domain-containing protein [Candidatus Latescibacterota bacterium]
SVGAESLTPGPFIGPADPWNELPPSGGADFAPQRDSSDRIQTNDSRVQNVVFRNGYLWSTQTVFIPTGSPTRSAVQWWQFDPFESPDEFDTIPYTQFGRIDDPAGRRFFAFPSIAVNANDDALIGYTRFGDDQYASANYSFRFADDPPNTMQDDTVLKAGEATYYKTFGGPTNRWGDYSATVVDPANDTDFWTIQEYAAAPANSWGTWWGHISPSNFDPPGTITTIAGTGTGGFGGDGNDATGAALNFPQDVFVDQWGTLLIPDRSNHRIRAIDRNGEINTFAGTGTAGFSGDGGPAVSAALDSPGGVYTDSYGYVYVADTQNHRIRIIDGSGVIATIAGNGTAGYTGDGGPAFLASLDSPMGVSVDLSGNVYIADTGNHAIRVIDGNGNIFTVVGDGISGFSGDGGPSGEARLNSPVGLTIFEDQVLLIADTDNHRVRFVSDGAIFTYAGSGVSGFSGDGNSADFARLNHPTGIYLDGAGNGYIADQGNSRVRRVDYDTGIITTVAGSGVQGFSGDGGLAVSADLDFTGGVFGDGAGNLLVADTNNHRVRKINDITSDGDATAPTEPRQFEISLSITADLPNTGVTTVPIISGQASTNTFVFLDSLPVPDPALQPIIDAINGMCLFIFNEGINQDVSLHINIGNVDATTPEDVTIVPLLINGVDTPVFFFLQMSMVINEIPQERFQFADGFPMLLKLPVSKFTDLLQNTGFGQVPEEDLGLVFVGSQGFDREGIFSITSDGVLIAEIAHLSNFAGVSINEIPLPYAPSIIEGPVVDADTSSALVFWQTDQPGNSVVTYGATSAMVDTARVTADSSGVNNHLVSITGLQKRMRYFYEVISTDPFGQLVSSGIDTFRTAGIGELPPIISLGPFDLFVAPTFAFLAWETDKRANSSIAYDTTTTLSTVESDGELTFEHYAYLEELNPGKKYFYQVSSSARGGKVSSDTLFFVTPSVLDENPPVITLGPIVDSYSVTDTTALIGWFTDTASNSQVKYWAVGTTDTADVFDADLSTDHFVVLNHLKPNTTYGYSVRSTRTSNNLSTSSISEEFTTLLAGQFLELQFTRLPEIVYRSDRQVIFEWETNVPSDEFIFYAPDSIGIFRIDEAFVSGRSRFTTAHRASIGGLTPGTDYLFIITSESPNGEFVYYPPDIVLVKPIVQGITKALVAVSGLQAPNSTGRFTTNQGPDTQAPVIINGPIVVGRNIDQVVIQWETDEVSTSTVQYGTDSNNLSSSVKDPRLVARHRATLTNLEPNTTYTFRVGSTDPINNGPTLSPPTVAVTTITSDTTPPTIDDSSIVDAPSDTRATLRWLTNEPTHTKIVFGTHQDSMTTTLTSPEDVIDHTALVTSLKRDTDYYYQLLATDASGNGPIPSATHSFKTTSEPDTTRPVLSDVQVAAIVREDSSASLVVSWKTDRLATTIVEYDTTSLLERKIVVQEGVLDHSHTVTNLQRGQRYYLRVGSANINDLRLQPGITLGLLDSLDIPITVDTSPPSAPTNIIAVAGDGAVRVRWGASTDVSGILGYTITRGGNTLATNLPDTTYLDITVSNGTSYTYIITAIDNAGNISTDSAPSPVVTPSSSQVPTQPIASATGDTVSLQPILVIDNSSPVPGDPTRAVLTYGFQVATDSVFASLVASTTGIIEGTTTNPTHWQVVDFGQPDSTALEGGTTYYWRARANDGFFDGPWSGQLSFVTKSQPSTAVELATLVASSDRGVAVISWTVGHSDGQLAGFNLYRSPLQESGFLSVTSGLMVGDGTFEFRDEGVTVNTVYYYLVESVDVLGESTLFGPIHLKVGAPSEFALHQNAPNPFNPTTRIRFDLPKPSLVTLVVYNILGQEVTRLLRNSSMEAGFHSVIWNSRNERGFSTSSGVYFYRIQAGEFTRMRKMMLLK